MQALYDKNDELLKIIKNVNEREFVYKNLSSGNKCSECPECPICFDPFDLGENKVYKTGCNHIFHSKCLMRQLTSNCSTKHQCSMCRRDLILDCKEDSLQDSIPVSILDSIRESIREEEIENARRRMRSRQENSAILTGGSVNSLSLYENSSEQQPHRSSSISTFVKRFYNFRSKMKLFCANSRTEEEIER